MMRSSSLVRRAVLMLASLAAIGSAARAQTVVVQQGDGASADIVRAALAGPHVVKSGSGALVLPKDSTVTTTLVVIGRPTYLASKVQGDVVVIGADLFLRPGVDVSGRAVAIGGTVALTTLGRVAGGTESFRDETFDARVEGDRIALTGRELRSTDQTPVLQGAGIQGLMAPSYDRVDGLSLPVGAIVTLGDRAIEVQPQVTYRSRLGKFDPGIELRVRPDADVRFVARAARDTRTNDDWNYSDLVNSATVFFGGLDTRNYFRTDRAEGRLFARMAGAGFSIEPFVGGRFEDVRPITATGNVFSVVGRHDIERMLRPNPLVEPGHISSALFGAALFDTAGVVTSRLEVQGEQSFSVMKGRASFTQLTMDGQLGFPTFATQALRFSLHAVATRGDSVPAARFAYLGGSGTLPVLELLEQGGSELLFLESRYLIPVPSVVLPLVGSPVVTLRHLMGSAGVNSLPSLEQEIGVGIGLSALRLDFTTDVAHHRGHKFGAGISLSH